MKKLLFFSMLVNLYSMDAQTAFSKNDHVITMGYGFPHIFRIILLQDLENQDAQLKTYAKQAGNSYSYSSGGIAPLLFKYDFSVSSKFGIGISMGYFTANAKETYSYKRIANSNNPVFTQSILRNAKSFSAGIRFNYHFGQEDSKTDPYIGIALGYTSAYIITSYETTDPDYHTYAPKKDYQPLPLYFGLTIGARRYLSKHIGVYFEIGFDKWSAIQAGLAFRLGHK